MTYLLKGRTKQRELKSFSDLTPREKKFAELYVEHWGQMKKQDIAVLAGYPETSASNRASRLTNSDRSPHVVKYIEFLYNKEKRKYKDDLHHFKNYDRLIKGAESKGQFAAAINAEYHKGQAAGFYEKNINIKTTNLEGMTRDELEKRLGELEKKISTNQPIIEATVIETKSS
jgi:phage terminase small subunit